MSHNRKTLIGIGLEYAASWTLDGGRLKAVGDKPARWRWLTARTGALYAFSSGDKVLYIGRDATTLSKYLAELATATATISEAIRKFLSAGKEVRVLVLADHPTISWGPFAIDLAAGLEESLIKSFKPPWNRLPTENSAQLHSSTK